MLALHTFVNPEYSDNYVYKLAYMDLQRMSFTNVLQENSAYAKAEVGFRVLCKVLTYVSHQWVFALFVFSLITLGGYYASVRKYSSMYWLSVLLIMIGPFCQSLYVLRQHMAMGIVLYTYPFIIDKKIVPYLILCAIAFFIHQTAAIFLPIYFFYNLKGKKSIKIVLILFFLALYFYFSKLLYTSSLYAMETAAYGSHYYEYDVENGANAKMAILLLFLLLLRILLLKSEFYKEGINRLLSILLTVGFFISFVGIGYVATSRLNMYFSTLGFLYLPNTIQYFKKKEFKYLFGIGYFVLMMILFIKSNLYDRDDFWFFEFLR